MRPISEKPTNDRPSANRPIEPAGGAALRQAEPVQGRERADWHQSEQVLFGQSRPGGVESLWMALGGGTNPTFDIRLRVHYDGGTTLDWDIDFGTLLACCTLVRPSGGRSLPRTRRQISGIARKTHRLRAVRGASPSDDLPSGYHARTWGAKRGLKGCGRRAGRTPRTRRDRASPGRRDGDNGRMLTYSRSYFRRPGSASQLCQSCWAGW
jgi:hypothetical protein